MAIPSSTPKKLLSAFAILLVLFFLLSPNLQRTPLKLLSLPVGTSVYYLQLGSNGIFDFFAGIWDDYIALTEVEVENKQLRLANSALELENTQLREKGFLADRLQLMLDYKPHSKLDTLLATVIGRKPTQWFDTLTINKGSSDGIAVDMGVMTPEGVVGKVIHAAPYYAQVLLASDRNSAIGALVQRTRDEGIVQGQSTDQAQLKYLPNDSEAQVGDLLVTSGMEGSFTKGLKIGEISSIEKIEGALFLKIESELAVNLSKVEEVLVIRSRHDHPSPMRVEKP